MSADTAIQVFLVYPTSLSLEGLSPEECIRAEKLLNPSQRIAFASAHRNLRKLISKIVGTTSTSLTFDTAQTGKPLCTSHPDIRFNLSHTHGAVAIAISEERAVGIDIEAIRPLPELDGMIASVATKYEFEELQNLTTADCLQAFYKLWTAKESIVKANGIGLSLDLRTLNLGTPVAADKQKGIRFSSDALGEYHWCAFDVDPGFSGSLAWSGGPAHISLRVLPD